MALQMTVTNVTRERRSIRCDVGFFKTQEESSDGRNVLNREMYEFDFVSPDNSDDPLAFCYGELKRLDEFVDAEDV